ncbi:hypothetical protein VTL71DRAFT_8851 [Oculimacula yallundae]|uniref:Uncharacterized protein n=1 Tax=Oculimacula yallundae TaxID=86028 RepID=A0ABR4BUR3_9HELO
MTSGTVQAPSDRIPTTIHQWELNFSSGVTIFATLHKLPRFHDFLFSTMSKASKARVWLASFLSLIIGVPTFYFSCLFVGKFIASIQSSSSQAHWIGKAKIEAYALCYDGCYDCLDVGVIESACRLTGTVNVPNVVCDASQLWTWHESAKYPMECLMAVGKIYLQKHLAWKRFWFKPLYLVAFLAAGGLGYATFQITRKVLDSHQAFEPSPARYRATEPPRSRPQIRTGSQSNITTPLLAVGVLLLASPPPVMAYACTSQPAYNALFSNADDSIYGVIHGWLSSCYEETYSCGESCTSSSSSGYQDCKTMYCNQERTAKPPRVFVNEAAQLVVGCGFRMVDFLPGVVDRRIPNPKIEGKLWVKISVNKFNGTELRGETRVEDIVKCLYGIVKPPKWQDGL